MIMSIINSITSNPKLCISYTDRQKRVLVQLSSDLLSHI